MDDSTNLGMLFLREQKEFGNFLVLSFFHFFVFLFFRSFVYSFFRSLLFFLTKFSLFSFCTSFRVAFLTLGVLLRSLFLVLMYKLMKKSIIVALLVDFEYMLLVYGIIYPLVYFSCLLCYSTRFFFSFPFPSLLFCSSLISF